MLAKVFNSDNQTIKKNESVVVWISDSLFN